MPHRIFAPLFALAAILPLTACDTVQSVLDGMNKPNASIVGVDFGSLSMDRANLVFDVRIDNPYDVPLPLTNLDYGLSSGGSKFVSGAASMQGAVPARGEKTIQLPVDIVFADVLAAVSGVRPGAVVPYKADLTMSVDVPNVPGVTKGGKVGLPMSKAGEVPVPAPPRVAVKNIAFDSLNLSEASGVLELEVENTNAFAADLNALAYSLSLSGTPIVNTRVEQGASFKPGKAQTVRIPISFKPSNLGLAALNMLKGAGASYAINGDLDVGTKFGALSMPFDRSGSTSFSRN